MSNCNSNWPFLRRMVWSRGYQLVANTYYLPFAWFISKRSFFWSTSAVSIARTGPWFEELWHDWNATIRCSVIWKSKKERKHVLSRDQIGALFGSVPIKSDYNWSRSTVIYILKIVVWLRETTTWRVWLIGTWSYTSAHIRILPSASPYYFLFLSWNLLMKRAASILNRTLTRSAQVSNRTTHRHRTTTSTVSLGFGKFLRSGIPTLSNLRSVLSIWTTSTY